MAVVEKTQSNEEKETAQAESAKASSDIAQSIIKTLDLPTSISSAVDDKIESEEDSNIPEDKQEAAETQEQETSNEEESESQEDELIPKSKVQKRIDELTRNSKRLEAELKQLRNESKSKEPKDPDLDKLQSMSVDELKETRKKILKAQRTADEATLDQLFELEEKVNKTIESAPQRFQSTQVERFNEAVAETTDLSDSDLKLVFGHANAIFSRTPSFQRSIDGQAEAWNLAVEHYRAMNKLTVGKSKVNELERKVNDLKKKTSLDTAVQKGNSKLSEESKLFNRAKNGTSSDKEAFLKKRLNTDDLIPDEYKR